MPERHQLAIELVPETAWGQNLRAALSKRDWDVIRKFTYQRAGHKCQACGGVGPTHPVECHELWHWDESWRIQWLSGLVALCPKCHHVTHWGRSMAVKQYGDRTVYVLSDHLKQVNGWDDADLDNHLNDVYHDWTRRSTLRWHMDINAFLTQSHEAGDFQLFDWTP